MCIRDRDIDYAGEKTQCALLVAVELVAQTEGYANYDKFYEALGMISNIIRNARTHVAARAEAFAEERVLTQKEIEEIIRQGQK